jgi:hypothetical protein
MLSYAPPVMHLLMMPLLLAFTGMVQWYLVSDEASAPGHIGEIYGKFGQYTLAYFPWDRAHSIAWLVIASVLVVMSVLRISLSGAWSDSEQEAVDDSDVADWLVVVSLGLVALFYVPAVQIARPGSPGVLCAILSVVALLSATACALTAVRLYDPWGRKSIATLLFGELTWGVYAGWLVYCSAMAVSASVERLRYEPDPHWLYRVISAPSNQERAKMFTAASMKFLGTNVRNHDPQKTVMKTGLAHRHPPVLRPESSSGLVPASTLPGDNHSPVLPAAEDTEDTGDTEVSMLVPASMPLGVGALSTAARRAARLARRERTARKDSRNRGAFWDARNKKVAGELQLDYTGNLNGTHLAMQEARATTQWFRYEGVFVRDSYEARRRVESADGEGAAGVKDAVVFVATRIRSGSGELSWGVGTQAVLVAGAALALRSPTIPVLPMIGFNNLVPLNNGPRLFGSLLSVAAILGSTTLGVWRWTEA